MRTAESSVSPDCLTQSAQVTTAVADGPSQELGAEMTDDLHDDCTSNSAGESAGSKNRLRRTQLNLLADNLTQYYAPSSGTKRKRVSALGFSFVKNTPSARDLQLEVIRKQLSLVAKRQKLELEASLFSASESKTPKKYHQKENNPGGLVEHPRLVKHANILRKTGKRLGHHGIKLKATSDVPTEAVMKRKRGRPSMKHLQPDNAKQLTKAALQGSITKLCQLTISDEDRELFDQSQKSVQQKLTNELAVTELGQEMSYRFVIGQHQLFISGHNIIRTRPLFVCEYCFHEFGSRRCLSRHQVKCCLLSVPGNEIYRSNNISVFEVDGQTGVIYCKSLCHLARYFFVHPSLWHDVSQFVYYVLYVKQQLSHHSFVGFICKEKVKNSMECIMVMPQFQRHGYGRLLVDLWYRAYCSQLNGPVPRLSVQSEAATALYASWCKSVVLDYLVKCSNQSEVQLSDVARSVQVNTDDVASSLKLLNIAVADSGQININAENIKSLSVKEASLHIAVDDTHLLLKELVLRQRQRRPRSSTVIQQKQYHCRSSPEKLNPKAQPGEGEALVGLASVSPALNTRSCHCCSDEHPPGRKRLAGSPANQEIIKRSRLMIETTKQPSTSVALNAEINNPAGNVAPSSPVMVKRGRGRPPKTPRHGLPLSSSNATSIDVPSSITSSGIPSLPDCIMQQQPALSIASVTVPQTATHVTATSPARLSTQSAAVPVVCSDSDSVASDVEPDESDTSMNSTIVDVDFTGSEVPGDAVSISVNSVFPTLPKINMSDVKSLPNEMVGTSKTVSEDIVNSSCSESEPDTDRDGGVNTAVLELDVDSDSSTVTSTADVPTAMTAGISIEHRGEEMTTEKSSSSNCLQSCSTARQLAQTAVHCSISLHSYAAPVMAAEACHRYMRVLPSTATSLCDTLTVSSPSFSLPICTALARSSGSGSRPVANCDSGCTGSLEDVLNAGFSSSAWLSTNAALNFILNPRAGVSATVAAENTTRNTNGEVSNKTASNGGLSGKSPTGTASRTPKSACERIAMVSEIERHLENLMKGTAGDHSGVNGGSCPATTAQNISPCQMNGQTSGLPSATGNVPVISPRVPDSCQLADLSRPPVSKDIVCSVATPVMADVLLRQSSGEQMSVRPFCFPAVGVPLLGAVRLPDSTAQTLMGNLFGQVSSPTEGLTAQFPAARQSMLPTAGASMPMIALINFGSGFASLPAFSCAAVIPQGALQFLNLTANADAL